VREPVARGIMRLVAMTVAPRVVRDNAPSAREPLDHPGLDPMLLRAGAEAVDHQHRRAMARVEVMNFYAVGIEGGHRDKALPRARRPSYNSRRPGPATVAVPCAGARDNGKIALERDSINAGYPMSQQNNKLGLHLSVVSSLFGSLGKLAQEAEESGYDSLWVA